MRASVCVFSCLCNRAPVGLEWFWSIRGRHSHPGLLNSTLCVCVLVAGRRGEEGAGSRCSHGWHRATLPTSPSWSESTMGDPVKQYRPRNKALHRASDTLSLKRETLQNAGGWNRNGELISSPLPLHPLPVTPFNAGGISLRCYSLFRYTHQRCGFIFGALWRKTFCGCFI